MAVTGIECKAYRNTATWATPTWVEVDNIRDVNITHDVNMAEFKTRGNSTIRNKETTTVRGVTFQMEHDPATAANDANFEALSDAIYAGTEIEMAFMNGAIATSDNQGVRGVWLVKKMDVAEPLEDAQLYDVELVPAVVDGGNAVQWYEVP